MRILTAPDFRTLQEILRRELDAVDPSRRPRVLTPGEGARAELRLRLAEARGGLFGIDVESLPAFIERTTAARIAREGGVPLSEAALDRLVGRQVVRHASSSAGRDAIGRLGDVPGVAAAVAATFRDLMQGGFAPDDLAPDDLGPGPLGSALHSLYAEFLTTLERERWWDRRGREALATRHLPNPAPPTLLFGFHDLTALQRRLVRAMAEAGDVVLLVPGPAGNGESEPGEAAAAPILQWATALGAKLEVEPRAFAGTARLVDGFLRAPEIPDPGPDALRLIGYATEADEVRGIAREIRRLVREGRGRHGDVLVTVPPSGPSPQRFRRIFARAGIPLRDRVGIAHVHTGEGRCAALMARAATAPPDDRDREALAFLPGHDPDRDEAQAVAVERLLAARSASACADAFTEWWTIRFEAEPGEGIRHALTAIRTVHGHHPLPPREFAAALAEALAGGRERDGALLDDSVWLVSAAAARFHSRPIVFHAGRLEGSSRRPPPADPLLPDRVRRRLNERFEHAGKFLPVGEDRAEEPWLLTRFLLETASRTTILSWAQRERIGTEIRGPSALLLDLASRRAGRPLEAYGDGFTDGVEMDDGAAGRIEPVGALDHDLARFTSVSPPDEDDLVSLLEEPRARHLAPALRADQARWRGGEPGAHDGVLTDERAIGRIEALLRGRAWSATALESLANCPFSYLLRLLKLTEDRREEDDFDPMQRGKIFHSLMERIHTELLRRELVPLTPEVLPDALEILDRHVSVEAESLRREPMRRRLPRGATLASLRDDVAILLAREAHRPEAERTVPVRVEMAFGPDDDPAHPPPSLELPSGAIALRGKIDRVDRRADGLLEVVDLKTGRARARSHELRSPGNGKSEIRLQLPLYFEAARQVLGHEPARAYYSYATTDRDFSEVEFTSEDHRAFLPEVLELLEHLLERARAGWFPCTPGTGCCYRDLNGACGPNVAARFRRKRSASAVADHLRLVRGDE